MSFFIVLGCLILVNLWVTRRVLRAGDLLDHKGLHIGMVWIAPFIGALMTWFHLIPCERLRKAGPAELAVRREAPPAAEVAWPGVPALPVEGIVAIGNGLPFLDWRAVDAWLAR